MYTDVLAHLCLCHCPIRILVTGHLASSVNVGVMKAKFFKIVEVVLTVITYIWFLLCSDLKCWNKAIPEVRLALHIGQVCRIASPVPSAGTLAVTSSVRRDSGSVSDQSEST